MYNYPDGFDGRRFDTHSFDVTCPECNSTWEEDWSGNPDEFDTECEDCGHAFTFYVPDSRY